MSGSNLHNTGKSGSRKFDSAHVRPYRLPPIDLDARLGDEEQLYRFNASDLQPYDVPNMRPSSTLTHTRNKKFQLINGTADKKRYRGSSHALEVGFEDNVLNLEDEAVVASLPESRGSASSQVHRAELPPPRVPGKKTSRIGHTREASASGFSETSSASVSALNPRVALLKEAFLGDRHAEISEQSQRMLAAADGGRGLGAAMDETAAMTLDLDKSVVPSEDEVLSRIRTSEDAVEYFSTAGKDAVVKFVYLNRKDTGDSFRPYDLVVVGREEVDPEHFTMSASGVVHVKVEEPAEFMSLAEWVRQSSMFNALTHIRYFKHYLVGKMFTSWRKNVRYKLYCATRNRLATRFFVAKPTFVTTLMEIQKLSVDAQSVKLFQFVPEGQKNMQTPEGFLDQQAQQRIGAAKAFEAIVDKVEEHLVKLCENVVSRARAPELGGDANDLEKLLMGDPGSSGADGSSSLQKEARKTKSMVEIQQEEMEKVRAVRRAQAEAKMLGDFVRLVDYMLVENLIQLVMSILKDFLSNLQPAEKKRLLFHVNATFSTDPSRKVDLLPGEADLVQMFRSTFDEIVATVNAVARVLYMRSFKQYFGGRVPATWNVANVIRGLEDYISLRGLCEGILRSDFSSCMDYAASLLEFHHWFVFSTDWLLDGYKQQERSVDEYKTDFYELRKAISTVEREMKTQQEVGNIFVDSKRLKNTLLPQLGDVLENMKNVLGGKARDRCVAILDDFSARIKLLQDRPEKLHGFASFVESVNKIKEESWKMLNVAGDVDKMYELLGLFEVKIPTEDQVKHDDLQIVQQDFQKALQGAEDHKQMSMSSMTVTLDRTIESINEELLGMVSQLRSGDYVDASADPKYVLEKLAQVKVTIDAIQEKTVQFSGYQKLFSLAPASWENLAGAQKQYGARHDLWQKLSDFTDKTEAWRTESRFVSLNVEDMNKEVQIYYKDAFSIHKKIADAVSERLLSLCEEWKTYMPVVLELGNPAMRPRHWVRVFEALGRPYTPEMDFSLDLLLSYGVYDQKDLVSEVSAVASGEYSLEVTLNKIREGWAVTEFAVKNHREQKDIFILGGVDDVMQLLEDNQVTLQTMMASRFVVGIKDAVEEWEQKLRLLQEVMDEWLTCQRNWMYLEFIFSSEDIQRQLPTESMKFKQVDREWKDIMRRCNANPNVIGIATAPRTLDIFRGANRVLEEVQKSLEDYLETKRSAFPRFYFLSNDELLEILSQTREPRAVQPHLTKCFDSIKELQFKDDENPDIVAMRSAEGELVKFSDTVVAEGNVEGWLLAVESMMRRSLYDVTREAMEAYAEIPRETWFFEFPAQSVLVVDQIMWTREVTEALERVESGDNPRALQQYKEFYISQLGKMVQLVRGQLSKLERSVMGALIVLDVHCRDVVDRMVAKNCSSVGDFEWVMQLRYYWEQNVEDIVVRQVQAAFRYGYEYLGNQPRLVITPLTDRCYLTCTGALHLRLGGAPQGPAGTGKTESVKDLAKALARQCVVFNCSDGLDYKMMGRMFSGLAQAGAWACFDEFNRIDIEVLSVIAQQLLTIIRAILQDVDRFLFEGRELALNKNFGVFITMNPGYAGRTELPDNLKALFRPMAMMVPDYALIAEIMLFSEGFGQAGDLARKMVQLFKLSSEQLSKQDHYDFGMRAVKSILVMAGALKRAEPELAEDIVLIRAMRDSNVPKFLQDDVVLFMAIIQDLFPGVEIPDVVHASLVDHIHACMLRNNLQIVPSFTLKVVQLYETMRVRHGVMLVGATGSGKTVVHDSLQGALTDLALEAPDTYNKVSKYVLNPKSLSMGELYGEFNEVSHEWTDGLVPTICREIVRDTTQDRKWVVFDGPVDALWIENMNTVLDDNKMLCLVNGERIKLPPTVSMMFEVQDLAVASPATVSRCGMVYLEPLYLDGGWKPLVLSWISGTLEQRLGLPPGSSLGQHVQSLFCRFGEACLDFLRKNCKECISSVNQGLVVSCMRLMESLLFNMVGGTSGTSSAAAAAAAAAGAANTASNPFAAAAAAILAAGMGEAEAMLDRVFAFSLVWSVGATVDDASRPRWDSFLHSQLAAISPDFPMEGSVYDYGIDVKTKTFVPWKDLVQDFKYEPEMPFFNILVPTVDTTRTRFLLDALVRNGRNVLVTGVTGVGKTVIIQDFLRDVLKTDDTTGRYASILANFSAQTSSHNLQDLLESKLEKKRKTLLGAPAGKMNVFVVDDLNMPALEQYGAQPPIELLRQILDQGGFYDRQKLFLKNISDTLVIASCGPPGGGRNAVTPRLLRHFHLLAIPQLGTDSMKRIFEGILGGFLGRTGFSESVSSTSVALVAASVDLYLKVSSDLLPTPSKSHYTFNLRDLSKIIQGMLQITPACCQDRDEVLRLWCHEASRVFRDRLVDDADRSWFNSIIQKLLSEHFAGVEWETSEFDNLLYGDFAGASHQQMPERRYIRLQNMDKVQDVLREYGEEYAVEMNKQMDIVFFKDAVAHVARICRILRQPRGNALLVGMGGSGRQSLTRLAAFVNDYKCFSIEIAKNYGTNEFREDLKKVLLDAGCNDKPIVFLFSDTQIVKESFLEDINSILNTGEVPNLFGPEELERIMSTTLPRVKAAGKPETRDVVYAHFVQLVRENLHVVLAMSPVGDAFRTRLRMFPALVNNCTIDWYNEWPSDALLSVAKRFIGNSSQELFGGAGAQRLSDAVCQMCVVIHTSVSAMSKKFFAELRRHNYTTPTSYLELINLYISILKEQREKVSQKIVRLKGGLDKLLSTNVMVENMKAELRRMQPILERSAKETEELLVQLTADQKEAAEVRANCVKEEAECKVIMEDTQKLKDDCQKDLDTAMPAFHAAVEALNSLNKSDITEIKSFKSPPPLVMTVMEAVCLLKNVKPDWKAATGLLADTGFLQSLVNFDKDNIPAATIKKLRKYIDDPEFDPEKVAKVSKAAKSLCLWVCAINTYAEVAKNIEPKKAALAEAEARLGAAKAQLETKQTALAAIEARVRGLQELFNTKQKEKKKLEDEMKMTEVRLERANKLVLGLADERTRWDATVKQLESDRDNLVGNMVLAAGSIAYLGPFTSSYRQQLMGEWIRRGQSECGLPISADFSLERKIAEPVQVRDWMLKGLPADSFSIENGILVNRGRRWPLMIDPQGQANAWIKNTERTSGLKVIKLTDGKFLQTLENCIRIGTPCLLENVGESLDPALEPILLRQTFKRGGQLLIRLGDTDVPFSPQFRFYITTKLPNPHYLPEVCIKVTVLNFTVTPKGLEDQLLVNVVQFERPDLEQQKDKLVLQIADGQRQLKEIEDKILTLLANSSGDILDDEVLINTLAASKKTSAEINRGVVEAEETARKINETREGYRPVAKRGSVLYFVVADMSQVDPMYQYSLSYFINLFNLCLKQAERSSELAQRLRNLIDYSTESIFRNICRGLFEKDKLIFSFMIAVQIMRVDGRITDQEWNFFLRGGDVSLAAGAPLAPSWLGSPAVWTQVCALSRTLPTTPLFRSLAEVLPTSVGWRQWVESEDPLQMPVPVEAPVEQELSTWHRLLLLKVLREERVIFGCSKLVSDVLGPQFSVSPPFDLLGSFKDSTPTTPIIFVLSPGADPAAIFLNFAKDCGFSERLRMLSLGQGQGPIAEKLIEQGMKRGEWICLQNCHLAASWMPTLEKILEDLGHVAADQVGSIHPDFRLWLTSMPSPQFPVPVLQLGIKLTNEPPKGLKANIRRSFAYMSDAEYEWAAPSESEPAAAQYAVKAWRKLLFGLAFFHASIQERRKFGPLGWNIAYDWNDSDFSASVQSLKNFLEESRAVAKPVPWDALRYVIGVINYAGRVTDFLDLRAVQCILERLFTPKVVEDDGYRFSADERYFAPPSGSSLSQLQDYVAGLPPYEEPSVFGLHQNANITFQKKETTYVLDTVISMQPRSTGSGSNGGKSNDDIAFELADDLARRLPMNIDTSQAHPSSFAVEAASGAPTSLSTVLSQEVAHFNKLLDLLRRTLGDLKRAIKGVVVMNDELETMYSSFLYQKVPPKWASAAYPSLKPLASWFVDMAKRIEFLRGWVAGGVPSVFWISGFYFPQGFLTGVLQMHARKYRIPIDRLRFRAQVMPYATGEDVPGAPTTGVYVSGLFMEGGRWDARMETIAESRPGELFTAVPVIWLEPEDVSVRKDPGLYSCPVYKTLSRFGVLSTTGLSSSLITILDLPCNIFKSSDAILKSVALFCALAD